MIGGPIDSRCSPTRVNDLAAAKSLAWFEGNLIDQVPAPYPGRGDAGQSWRIPGGRLARFFLFHRRRWRPIPGARRKLAGQIASLPDARRRWF